MWPFRRTPVIDPACGDPRARALLTALGARDRQTVREIFVTAADPDTFEVGRDPNPHVGFGAGLHFCLGAPLARLELRAAVGALLDHAPHLTLAAEPVQRPTFVLRGYTAVRLSRYRKLPGAGQASAGR